MPHSPHLAFIRIRRVCLISLAVLLIGLACAPSPPTASTPPPPPPTSTALASETISQAATPTASHTPSPTATSIPPTPTPTPTLSLAEVNLPPRNLDELARRFQTAPTEAIPPPGKNFSLGDSEAFWVSDNTSSPPRQFELSAELRYLTDHAYWWVEQGQALDSAGLQASAERFETLIYPRSRELFGSEPSPGIDDDGRVHVLLGRVPGVAGYFAASNAYSQAANPFSNQREMFVINMQAIQPGSTQFDSVIAHEFQHMIHWNMDRNEDTWLNEGLSEFASLILGLGESNFQRAYLNQPDTQLTSWSLNPGQTLADYGASYLFVTYLHQRFGEDVIRSLVAHPENGSASVTAALRDHAINLEFDPLFADFALANWLNDPTLAQGQWGYLQNGPTQQPQTASELLTLPTVATSTVKPYGVDYLRLNLPQMLAQTDSPTAPLKIAFSGQNETRLLPNTAHSGQFQWYSLRGDQSHPRLSRAFDLRDVSQATLEFWAWYDIEPSWDYAYVTVSTDGGSTWDILPATTTTTDNPVGNAFGPGFTGQSGGWAKQVVDLTAYAGQEIRLGFEMVTDDAINHVGFAVDDIAIPELSYFDDVEAGPGGWQAEGFVRTNNVIPQNFSVWLIAESPGEPPLVEAMSLDASNTGSLSLADPARFEAAVLMITAHAPVTTEAAQYRYRIDR